MDSGLTKAVEQSRLSVEPADRRSAEKAARAFYGRPDLPIWWFTSPVAAVAFSSALGLAQEESGPFEPYSDWFADGVLATVAIRVRREIRRYLPIAHLRGGCVDLGGRLDLLAEIQLIQLHCHAGIYLADRCILIERPKVLAWDEAYRLHCTDGPALSYRDGSRLYVIHGVRVPQIVVEDPDFIDSDMIDAEANTEVRRVMIERIGMDRYVKQGSWRVIDDGPRGTLWAHNRDDGGSPPHGPGRRMVEVRNATAESDGSVKTYWLSVPPDVDTADEAVAWTFGKEACQYHPDVES